MSYERITDEKRFDGEVRDSHEVRYLIASGFVEDGDRVVDVGCGTGYGEKVLTKNRFNIFYFGVDKEPPKDPHFRKCNLNNSIPETPKEYDIFVGLEIIEHLEDEGVMNFLRMARESKKWVIISTPIVPNTNPYHIQQFKRETILQFFAPYPDWIHYETFIQKDIYGIFIFKKKI